jgi:hypothetical protein
MANKVCTPVSQPQSNDQNWLGKQLPVGEGCGPPTPGLVLSTHLPTTSASSVSAKCGGEWILALDRYHGRSICDSDWNYGQGRIHHQCTDVLYNKCFESHYRLSEDFYTVGSVSAGTHRKYRPVFDFTGSRITVIEF